MSQFVFKSGDAQDELSLKKVGEAFEFQQGDQVFSFEVVAHKGSELVLRQSTGEIFNLHVWQQGASFVVNHQGQGYEFDLYDEKTLRRLQSGLQGGSHDNEVISPMPGRVVSVSVKVGETVKAGQGVVVVEAMKMENEYKAPRDGVVQKVHVNPGQAVEAQQVLLALE